MSIARQRGLSMVEMMVGVAVGLIVLAGATMLVGTQLGENRRLLIETQLQQDMRASMDIITRELRRSGAQIEERALLGLWREGAGADKSQVAELTTSGGNMAEFRYEPGTASTGLLGFKRENGVVKTSMANAGWMELTDGNVLNVTEFVITPQHTTLRRLPCPHLCADDTGDCWPQVQARVLKVEMKAEPRGRPNEFERKMTTLVRLRNDHVRYNTGTAELCPS